MLTCKDALLLMVVPFNAMRCSVNSNAKRQELLLWFEVEISISTLDHQYWYKFRCYAMARGCSKAGAMYLRAGVCCILVDRHESFHSTRTSQVRLCEKKLHSTQGPTYAKYLHSNSSPAHRDRMYLNPQQHST